MFKNAGKKIKSVANWYFIIESAAAVIAAIGLIVEDDDLVPIGLLIILVGPLVAWLFSLMLYGFGEIVDTSIINRKEQAEAQKIVHPVVKTPHAKKETVVKEKPVVKEKLTTCPKCHGKLMMNNTYCVVCGEFVAEAEVKGAHEKDIRKEKEDTIPTICSVCNCDLVPFEIEGIMQCPECGRTFG